MIPVFYSVQDLVLREVYTLDFIEKHHIGFFNGRYFPSRNPSLKNLKNKRSLLDSVLMEGLDYILRRIVVEGAYYYSPFKGACFFALFMGKKPPKETAFILSRKKAMYRKINLLQTSGQIPQLYLYFPNLEKGNRSRRVHLGNPYWEFVCKRVSAGIGYPAENHVFSVSIRITNTEVIEQMTEVFPFASAQELRRILSFGFYRMAFFLKRNIPVRWHTAKGYFRAYTYRVLRGAQVKKARSLAKKLRELRKSGKPSPLQEKKRTITERRIRMRHTAYTSCSNRRCKD